MPDLIRVLTIFSAVSWVDMNVGSAGKTFFNVLKALREDIVCQSKTRTRDEVLSLQVLERREVNFSG